MKLIILDRDGVINEDSDNFIKSVDEWIPLPGSLKAIARLNQAGYQIAVATNQSGIARGLFSVEVLNAMHVKMQLLLKPLGGHVSGVFFCPHGPDDVCQCRKPLPGLFQQIAERYSVSLKDVYAIGDSLRDLQAAESAGAKPVLVRTGKGLRTLDKLDTDHTYPVYADLHDFTEQLLKSSVNP